MNHLQQSGLKILRVWRFRCQYRTQLRHSLVSASRKRSADKTAHGQACKNAGKPYDPTSLRSSEAPWQTTAISSVAADLLCQWGDALSTGEPAHDEYSIFYGSSDLYLLGDGSRQRN
ncbi:putative mannan endo-1,4-beta-mannosidase F [Talaromyces pinophilus]|nr:putative mannan endo-1,4-beta-mannosidase F [Talaromyces pinophilus]